MCVVGPPPALWRYNPSVCYGLSTSCAVVLVLWQVEKGLGERRLTNYTGVGISVCAALDPIAIIDGIADKEAQQQALAVAAHAAATEEYKVLEKAIKDPAFRAANKQFSQPWLAA